MDNVVMWILALCSLVGGLGLLREALKSER